ncbi:MAG: GNAT family N-acetyltransferase [Planctomycetaceae bacterium]|nr:GNAT family N-acetyltransferase [Planctomycetaceae bacterium]
MSVFLADLSNPAHQAAILDLLDMYCRNEFGDGKPLTHETRANLISGLIKHGGARVFLAYEGDEPAGLALCFVGFSSFKARPLVNVHDLAVAPRFRGRGIGKALLDAVADDARALGCCKVTLEVRADNAKAIELYRRAGFESTQPAETWFLAKKL